MDAEEEEGLKRYGAHVWRRDKGGTDCSADRGKWAAGIKIKKGGIEQKPDRGEKRNE